MRDVFQHASRKYLFRLLIRLLGMRALYRSAMLYPSPFPKPTDPAKIVCLVETVRRRVPYYREHLPATDLKTDPLGSFAAMVFRTPKEVLKRDLWQVMDCGYTDAADSFDYKKGGISKFWRLFRSDFLVRVNTSGSTGRPLEFFKSKQTTLHLLLSILQAMRSLGWREGDGILSAWQAIEPTRRHMVRLALRAVGTPIFTFTEIDDAVCRDFLDLLDLERAAVLFGFPSYYVEFARFMRSRGLQPRCPPKFLLCGGEMLSDDQRALLEESFRTKVYNSYGGNEFGFVAFECRQQQGLHVLEHAFFVETDENDQLLLTTLDQHDMPLIKYETGDRAIIGVQPCGCGITGKKILRLEGRTEEYLWNGQGKRVYARYFREVLLEANHRFNNAIIRAQFRQSADQRLHFALQVMEHATASKVVDYLERRLLDDLAVPVFGHVAENLLPRQGKFKFLEREDVGVVSEQSRSGS